MLYALALLLAFLGQILDVGYLFHFIFFAVAALPFLGLAVSLPAMLGCRAELGGSAARIQRGENASWFLRLTNRFRLPVARVSCRLRLTNRLTGQVHRVKTVIRGAAPEEECRWKLETDHCGILDFQTERLWAWDCLGLFALPVGRSAPASLTIAPLPEHPGAVELPEDAGAPVPRPGGKAVFGETYELRPYREGDSLRTIHWKMSAKRDSLVTREALEDKRPLPVLTFDCFGPPAQVDRVLDRLLGHSMALLDQERPHEIRWADPASGAVRRYGVASERDWTVCLTAILSSPVPALGHSILDTPLTAGQDEILYQIHITGEEARDENP